MLINRSKTMALCAILCALLAGVPVAAEDILSYAKTCNVKVEVPITKFNCLDGELIPMEGVAGGNCKKPPYLHFAQCREGSRFGVQTANADVAIVWLCRKKKVTNPNNDIFDDIAIIQTNFKNGATCFYQHLGDISGSNVPAPVDDNISFWMSPAKAAEQECASCHDAGLLRTPYLTQLKKPIPKTPLATTNYWFPGTDFAGWNGKVYKVTGEAVKTCTTCHAMGANGIDPEVGTSTWLGPMATGVVKTPNLEGEFAFWMKPGLHAPEQKSKEIAELLKKCGTEPNGKVPGCNVSLWGGQLTAIIESQKGRTLPALRQPPAQEEPKPHDKQ